MERANSCGTQPHGIENKWTVWNNKNAQLIFLIFHSFFLFFFSRESRLDVRLTSQILRIERAIYSITWIDANRWVISLPKTDTSFRYKSGVQTNYVAKFVFNWFVSQHVSKTCWQMNQLKTIFCIIVRLNTGSISHNSINFFYA